MIWVKQANMKLTFRFSDFSKMAELPQRAVSVPTGTWTKTIINFEGGDDVTSSNSSEVSTTEFGIGI